MFKSFLKRSKAAPSPDGATPDISRVIPDFNSGAARIVPKMASRLNPLPESLDGEPDTEANETTLLLDEDRIVAEPAGEQAGEPDIAPAEEADEPVVGDWLSADVAALREAATAFTGEGGDVEDQRNLFLIAHNIRGAAGAYGFPVIERIAGSLCLLLERDDDPQSAGALINLHVEACRAATNHRAGKASAELAEAVCTALEDQVSARLTGWG